MCILCTVNGSCHADHPTSDWFHSRWQRLRPTRPCSVYCSEEEKTKGRNGRGGWKETSTMGTGQRRCTTTTGWRSVERRWEIGMADEEAWVGGEGSREERHASRAAGEAVPQHRTRVDPAGRFWRWAKAPSGTDCGRNCRPTFPRDMADWSSRALFAVPFLLLLPLHLPSHAHCFLLFPIVPLVTNACFATMSWKNTSTYVTGALPPLPCRVQIRPNRECLLFTASHDASSHDAIPCGLR